MSMCIYHHIFNDPSIYSMDLTQAFNQETIQLEPRLQEYMRRKKFNNQNSIRSDIPEEQEFAITRDDLKMIRKYTKGNENLYSEKSIGKMYRHDHMVRPITTFFDDTNDFKKDERYQRILKKAESHKKATDAQSNLNNMDSEYSTFFNSNPYEREFNGTIERPYIDPKKNTTGDLNKTGSQYMMDSRDLAIGPSRPQKTKKASDMSDKTNGSYRYNVNNKQSNPNIYNHPPSISLNQYLTPQKVNGGLPHKNDLNQLIGTIDEYQKNLNRSQSMNNYQDGSVDMDTKQMIGGKNMRSQRETTNQYNSVPMMYGMGMMDVCVEESLRGHTRDTSKKTAGYRNMFENNFQYISPEISDPNHTVAMYPNSTRGTGKELARPSNKRIT